MAGIKNKYEFYKGFLEALGAQDVAETEYRNEEELRRKILDTMGVEYVLDDVNQTDLFRGKFLEGLANGGGGSSDFSTAKVTISGLHQGTYIEIPTINPVASATYGISPNAGEGENDVVLYKGVASFTIDDTIETTGDITYDSDTEVYFVHGDGTITVNPS